MDSVVRSIVTRLLHKIFRRDRLSALFVTALFTSGLVGIAGLPNSHAATSTKTITTCTNIKTGLNRLLIKGACNKTEKKSNWVKTGTTGTTSTITTCTNIKTGLNRLLIKGACNKTENKAIWVSTTPTSTTTSSAAFTYKVGDKGPGGGLIFFVNTKNEYPGFTYLEAAPADVAGTFTWCNDTTRSIPAVLAPEALAVGRGSANTTAMVAVCSSGAANAAQAYSNNGKSDWFLPSFNELRLMYANIRGSRTFAALGFGVGGHWSSSEDGDTVARYQPFDDRSYSSGGSNLKRDSFYVRPIRAFSTTPTPTTTSPAAFTYKVGDTGPGGGLIFFVDTKNEYPGFTYLEAAPASCESTKTWSSDTTHSNTSAKSTKVGTGQANTTAMMTSSGSYTADTNGAAFYADTLTCGGKSDWFLGSHGEMVEMYNKLRNLGGFATGAYWSSSEAVADGAWYLTFHPVGSQDYGNKSSTAYVRPIRAFSATSIPTPTPTTTSSASFAYKVGDAGPGGGLIFFVDTKNEYPGFTYLEAAPFNIPGFFLWCSNNNLSLSVVTGKAAQLIGMGQANTTAMIAACTSGAANAARAYSSYGKSDWYLPSRDELNLMYANIRSIGRFDTNVLYWSSSEISPTHAWVQSFSDGLQSSGSKNFNNPVRAIRSF